MRKLLRLIKHRLYQVLGIVSPSGAYPPPGRTRARPCTPLSDVVAGPWPPRAEKTVNACENGCVAHAD
jgi:hypothetical protein